MPETRTRILLIDDHALFREAVARSLGAEPDFQILGTCGNVAEAIEILKSDQADVVLLDINLGAEQGGLFLTRASSVGFRGKVLVVTAGVNETEAARLLHRGCSGIFLKHEPLTVLIHRIRALAAGVEELDRTSAAAILRHAAPDSLPTRKALTTREGQVLRGIFRGFSNKEVAAQLGVSEALVKAVVHQLFGKTNVRTRSQLVRVAIERYWDQLENGVE
jgi:DNA-binding NarL/FixJ family response regulator